MAAVKDKIKQIYGALPQIDCGLCGFEGCGQFAKAVAEGRAKKTWNIQGDRRVRPSHWALSGVTILIDAVFWNELSYPSRGPGGTRADQGDLAGWRAEPTEHRSTGGIQKPDSTAVHQRLPG